MSAPSHPEYVLDDLEHATLPERLKSVRPYDPVSVAITQMVAFGYSQMPVLTESPKETDQSETLHGVVTWQSVTRALVARPADGGLPQCKHACEPPEMLCRLSVKTPVADVLGVLFEHDFVLTFKHDRFHGIMTSSDVVRWADDHAMGLVEVRGADLRLRMLCDRFAPASAKRPEEMSFHDYQQALSGKACWDELSISSGWKGVDPQEFDTLINEARLARNAIVHFKCENDPEEYRESRAKVARLVRLLRFVGEAERPHSAPVSQAPTT